MDVRVLLREPQHAPAMEVDMSFVRNYIMLSKVRKNQECYFSDSENKREECYIIVSIGKIYIAFSHRGVMC